MKFTESGCVKLSVKPEANHSTLTVEDTGSGIPEEALDKLFERFYQTDVSHRQKGSGLGLSLVKSIADWHGGSVRASNHPKGGSVFQVSLPAA